MMPMVMMGFLYQPDMPAEHYLPLKKLWHEARHPRHDMVDEGYMNWARAQGYNVNAWTVNDPQRAIALRDLGVNAIITDEPRDLSSARYINAESNSALWVSSALYRIGFHLRCGEPSWFHFGCNGVAWQRTAIFPFLGLPEG